MAWPVRCRMCGVARALDHRLRGGVDAADGLALTAASMPARLASRAAVHKAAARRWAGRRTRCARSRWPARSGAGSGCSPARRPRGCACRRTRHRHATRTPGRSASRPGSPRTARPESARRLPAPIARPSRNPAPAPAARTDVLAVAFLQPVGQRTDRRHHREFFLVLAPAQRARIRGAGQQAQVGQLRAAAVSAGLPPSTPTRPRQARPRQALRQQLGQLTAAAGARPSADARRRS